MDPNVNSYATSAQWGVVPAPIITVLQRLKDQATSAVASMDTSPMNTHGAADHTAPLLHISASVDAADRATRDYRNVFNAYTHKFHYPKPPIQALAAAQGIIIQSFAKRYTKKTVAAIESLLSEAPHVGTILEGIPSLKPANLWSITDALDRTLRETNHSSGTAP